MAAILGLFIFDSGARGRDPGCFGLSFAGGWTGFRRRCLYTHPHWDAYPNPIRHSQPDTDPYATTIGHRHGPTERNPGAYTLTHHRPGCCAGYVAHRGRDSIPYSIPHTQPDTDGHAHRHHHPRTRRHGDGTGSGGNLCDGGQRG